MTKAKRLEVLADVAGLVYDADFDGYYTADRRILANGIHSGTICIV